MDINLITGIFCLIAISYVIYLEFKNPKKKRDIFIDVVIGTILIIISLFEMYEIDFKASGAILWIFVALILLGIFYIVIVLIHHKKYRSIIDGEGDKMQAIDENNLETNNSENNNEESLESSDEEK